MKNKRKNSGKIIDVGRREGLILTACVGLSLILHAISIITGFGEPDAARLATFAVEWHHSGTIHEYSYALRTSPLYIHGIIILLDLGIPQGVIPHLMNWLNVILGSLTLVSLYLLWRQLSRPLTSGIACLFFSATPAFWLANIYGMAHLPAFALFITSLLLFSQSMTGTNRNAITWMAASAVLAVLSVFLKADIILCFGAYLGMAICMHSTSKLNIMYSFVIPVVALLAVILYSNTILPGMPSLGGSVTTWATSFPFTIQAISDGYNRMIPVRTTGIFLFAACVLSIFYCLLRRRNMRLLLFCLMWACPLILFWGLKMGNSARHMMAAFCPLLLISSLVAVDIFKRPRLLCTYIAAVLIANYFVSYEGSSISPDSNLHRLTKATRLFAYVRHTYADYFADLVEMDNKAYVGNSTIPYVEWSVFLRCSTFIILKEKPRIYRLEYAGSHPQHFQIHDVKGPVKLGPSENWFIFTFENDILIKQHPKWIKYVKDNPRVTVETYIE
jgi:hypothetical protein